MFVLKINSRILPDILKVFFIHCDGCCNLVLSIYQSKLPTVGGSEYMALGVF